MGLYELSNIEISGIATAIPKNRMEYSDFYDKFGHKFMDKYVSRVGIKSLHRTTNGQTACDLGYVASKTIIDGLGLDGGKIGVLMFSTYEPDYRRPGNSFVLQYRLGLSEDCSCVDVGAGCAGFVYHQQTICSLLNASDAEYGLLVCAVSNSRYIGENDSNVVAMLGDAAVAILYHKSDNGIKIPTLLKARGEGFKSIIVPAGGDRHFEVDDVQTQNPDGRMRSPYELYMDGAAVFTYAINDVPDKINEYLKKTGNTLSKYDSVCLHQANLLIVNTIADAINCPRDKVLLSLDEYGNTGVASIPLTLCRTYAGQSGVKKILAAAFGVGFGLGITELIFDANVVFPIVETEEVFDDGLI